MSMTDRDWIATTLFGEARGETTAGRLAVASVLHNRLVSRRWGASYEAVCTAPKQFSCWNANDPNLPLLKQIIERIEAGETWADPVLAECYWIADGLLSGALRPQVRQATHYYAAWMKQPPKWAKDGEFVGAIGQHLFFQHVA